MFDSKISKNYIKMLLFFNKKIIFFNFWYWYIKILKAFFFLL